MIKMTEVKSWAWGLLTLVGIVLLGACSAWIASESFVPGGLRTILVIQWGAVLLTLLLMAGWAGYLANGRFIGVLIDDRNRISLGRLQWLLWFLVLFSAYFTGAVWDVSYSDLPAVEPNLFALIGLSTGSAMLSSVVVDNKKVDQSPTPNAVPPAPTPGVVPPAGAAAPTADANRAGKADVNASPADASFADLYLGEEVTNRQSVDASRLQKLVVTILLVAVYCQMLWSAFIDAASGHVFSMPIVGTNFLGLLGVSHAAYLLSKASPKQ
jgi:hypothetical protein